MILALLAVGIVIAGIVMYVRHRRRRRILRLEVPHYTSLEVLATRYARGEISREEYLQKRDDIFVGLVSESHPLGRLRPLRSFVSI